MKHIQIPRLNMKPFKAHKIVIISEEKQFPVVLISCSSCILKPSIEVYPLTVLF